MSSSSPTRPQPDHSEIELIVAEFFAKCLHIIYEARSSFVSSRAYSGDHFFSSPSSASSSSSVKSRDKWFNLALRDSPTVLDDICRRSSRDPLIVDVVLAERSSFSDLAAKGSSEKVVERWFLQYEEREERKGKWTCGSSSQSSKTYKRSLILLRSLYSAARLLPAYKVFRDLCSSAQLRPFNLSCKVSTFVEPFTRREEAEMEYFKFQSVATCCGQLCLGVMYVAKLAKFEQILLEDPQFIPDYVGSPTTDPIRRYPSMPSSPSRRHSWSSEFNRALPAFSPSSSPAYSDSLVLPSTSHGRSAAYHCQDKDNLSLVHRKNTNFEDNWYSPPFSPSPTPSPPTHSTNLLLRSESEPMRTSLPRLSKGSLLPGFPLPPSSPSSRGSKNSQVALSPNCLSSLSKNKCWTKPDSSKLKELSAIAIVQKKEDANSPFVDSKISGPRRTHLTGSSRRTFQDELDDDVFDFPFADDYLVNAPNRAKSFDFNALFTKANELPGSQDAAAGAIVHIFQSALPLREDPYSSLKLKQISTSAPVIRSFERAKLKVRDTSKDAETSSSGQLMMPKTHSDALDELKRYREMGNRVIQRRQSKNSEEMKDSEIKG